MADDEERAQDEVEPEGVPDAPPRRARPRGWRRMLRSDRALWITALVAVLSLVAGLALGRLVVSPGQAAADAEPPDAGPITVPVEERALSNDVVLRGDAVFADAVAVRVETAELGGPPVVTGQVPSVGTMLDVRSVALEVAGRPLIVLPGELPAYRSLRVGLSGPDVQQLHAALASLGLGVDATATVFDASTANAVRALYEQVGYPLPAPPEGAPETLDAAEAAMADAESAVAQAQAAVQAASSGPSAVERREQDNLVDAASRALQQAQAAPEQDALEVAALQDALDLAVLQRDAALAPRGAGAERQALDQAVAARERARDDLVEAQVAVQPQLPASEVVFLTDLPRRVDEVSVDRGGRVEGDVMSVSGATLEIAATASASDATLLQVGAVATFALPDGTEATATIAEIGGATPTDDPAAAGTDGEGGGASAEPDRVPVSLAPQALPPEAAMRLQGTNVRVSIPVEATAGTVLAVPIAALTAGPGGESRVEVVRDDETELVEVTTGLAAEGYVEVAPAAGLRLEPGDLVVVGR
ncbi:hypothetical protein GCM10009846_19110 [Agrococcus versicolor]|uniref:Peptidoglycan binding-like domain-containing protein n=1 Tax=Agrococcus versicolor TaxID=501482 RepID=A0ABN3AT49_9MICO